MQFRSKMPYLFACLGLILIFACNTSMAVNNDGISSWAENEVIRAISSGLVPSDMQNNYKQNISRCDFCRLVVVLLEKVYGKSVDEILAERGLEIDESAFLDTRDKDILAANALGIVNGVGNNLFNPDGDITRAQAATMLMRTANIIGDYSAFPYVYDDAVKIPDWARESVYSARAFGIMIGTDMNEFLPEKTFTREEAYITVLRLFDVIENGTSFPPFLYPMSAIQENGTYLWGYVDGKGNFVIEPKYAYASEWNGEYGIVSKPEDPLAYFVINRKEEHVAKDNDYYEGYFYGYGGDRPYFAGNLLCFRDSWLSLPDGKILALLKFYISYMSDGLIEVYDGYDHLSGYCDRNGRMVIPYLYRFAGFFYNGVAIVGKADLETFMLINKRNEILRIIDYKGKIPAGAIGDMMITREGWLDGNYNYIEKYGVLKADGTKILPIEYSYIRLTDFKQILVRKDNDSPYRLLDENGKLLYEFPDNFDGNLKHDRIGHYVFRSDDFTLTVIATDGEVKSHIPFEPYADFDFVSGLVQIRYAGGACRYYDIYGNIVIE